MDVSCFENETCGELVSGMELHQFLFDHGRCIVSLCFCLLSVLIFSKTARKDTKLHFTSESSNVG